MGKTLLIDGLGAKHGGAATVLRNVVEAALEHPNVERIVLVASPRRLRQYGLPESEKLVIVEQELGERTALRPLWQFIGLPLAARRYKCDAAIFLGGGGLPGPRIRGVNVVQQSLPFCAEAIQRLSWASRWRVKVLGVAIKLSVRNCDAVVVQTAWMKESVSRACGYDLDRIHVLEPAARKTSPRGRPSVRVEPMRRAAAETRLLYVGSDSRHKNLEVLSPALQQLEARGVDASLFATLPGTHSLAASPRVTCLGYLEPDEVQQAYEAATILIMPSIVETAGLPLVEACASGLAVLAADRPYAHEICGDAAEYFEPTSPASLADGVAKLLANKELRRQLGARGILRAQRAESYAPYHRLISLAVGVGRIREGKNGSVSASAEVESGGIASRPRL